MIAFINVSPVKSQLLKVALKLPGVKSCKIKYKSEKNAGELILNIAQPAKAEGEEGFSPINLKAVLIELQLEPLNFIELR